VSHAAEQEDELLRIRAQIVLTFASLLEIAGPVRVEQGATTPFTPTTIKAF